MDPFKAAVAGLDNTTTLKQELTARALPVKHICALTLGIEYKGPVMFRSCSGKSVGTRMLDVIGGYADDRL